MMRETNPKEIKTYNRVLKAIQNAVRPDDNPATVLTVLLKFILVILIKKVGAERAIELLSDGINECLEVLRRDKLI